MAKHTRSTTRGASAAGTPATAYEVLVGLSYPTDPAILRRLANGDNIPMEERGAKRAEPGEIVDDIPATSVPWLLEQGWIRPARGMARRETPAPPAPVPPDDEEE